MWRRWPAGRPPAWCRERYEPRRRRKARWERGGKILRGVLHRPRSGHITKRPFVASLVGKKGIGRASRLALAATIHYFTPFFFTRARGAKTSR